MALKTSDELLKELEAAVRSNGRNGKTTAQQVRTFLQSLIVELTTLGTLLGGGPGRFKSTKTITLTKDSDSGDVTADLRFSNTPEINLLANPAGGGLQGELTPAIRNSLPLYINAATDSRFLFFSVGKTYAFIGAAAAVAYAKANALAGIFVFRAEVREPLELLHNCTYDMTGFDSVCNDGMMPNFFAYPGPGDICQASLKIRRIIRKGFVTGIAVTVSGLGTEIQIDGDVILEGSNVEQNGIQIRDGAKLRYRGNIEARQNTQYAIYQEGSNCATYFVGNILIDSSQYGHSIKCLGGIFDFTGYINVVRLGTICFYRPNGSGNQLLRMHLLGATSKDCGLVVQTGFVQSSQLYIKGVIDMRESQSNDPKVACGIGIAIDLIQSTPQINIQFENLTVLTKPSILPVKRVSSIPNDIPISIIGKFYSTQAPLAGEFKLQSLTPYSFS